MSIGKMMDFWMASNRLKLNEDKTQVIWLGTLHSTSSHRSSRYRSTQTTSHTHKIGLANRQSSSPAQHVVSSLHTDHLTHTHASQSSNHFHCVQLSRAKLSCAEGSGNDDWYWYSVQSSRHTVPQRRLLTTGTACSPVVTLTLCHSDDC